MSDEIRLVLPAQEDFRRVADLVVGGLGARLALTLEDLEDLQVAVETLLACREDDDEVTVELRVDPDAVHASVGPFSREALEERESGELALSRVLGTVCDAYAVNERGDAAWVDVTKRTGATA